MSNQQHTPEPAGYAVMIPFENAYRFANTLESAKRKQDALISKFPNKKQGKISKLYTEDQLNAELSKVTAQRDELIAAFNKFIDSHEECTDFDGFTAQIVNMGDYHEAQEAIVSVKGGAA